MLTMTNEYADYKISIKESMIFEVTRRCNMKCSHCLRGKAENVDMTNKIINRALKQIQYINNITFTGGEPFLNTKAMKHIFRTLDKNNIDYSSFWLASNGLIYDQSMMNIFMEKYTELMENQGEFYGGIALSINDSFHNTIPRINKIKFQALKMYDNSKEGIQQKYHILNEGYAKLNKIGYREVKPSKVLNNVEIDDINKTITLDNLIYVNAQGDILLDCDMSYKTQKKYILGNVLDKSLAQIIIENYEAKKEYKGVSFRIA
jgi:MoaA/NifB/PqqE/SkfB family radical SAM enzyme